MTAGRPVVRPARVGDGDRIGEIHVRSWQAAYETILPSEVLDGLSVERRAAHWRATIERGTEPVWVAEDDTVVVGFVSGGPARDDDLPGTAGEVYAIYLEPTAWGKGFGRALFAAAEDDLRARGRKPLVLWILTDNARGRRFYEAARWRPDGSERSIEIGGAAVAEIRYRSPRG